jgi:D-methionine transport system ATP-binding protein
MIELKNIHKSFHTKSGAISALEHVSLSVDKGQIFGVIGKSGAGKSTLVRCVNLLERPDEGEVWVDEQPLLKLSAKELRQARHNMGMIFQHFNLLSSQTVYQNIALPLQLMKKTKADIQKTILPLLELVGLADRRNAYPNQLSGGQKQRVAIARALATKPKVLLCDEMTSALDPQTTQSILELIKDINAKMHLTILLITHEMEVIKRICDKVAVINEGKIIEHGDVLQVFCAPKDSITKDLTRAAFHLELPPVLQRKMHSNFIPDGYTLLQISFVGDSAGEPIINNLIHRFNLQISILQSDLEMLHTKTIGMMLLAAKGSQDEIKQAMHYLSSIGLIVEVVGYVSTHDWHFS